MSAKAVGFVLSQPEVCLSTWCRETSRPWPLDLVEVSRQDQNCMCFSALSASTVARDWSACFLISQFFDWLLSILVGSFRACWMTTGGMINFLSSEEQPFDPIRSFPLETTTYTPLSLAPLNTTLEADLTTTNRYLWGAARSKLPYFEYSHFKRHSCRTNSMQPY